MLAVGTLLQNRYRIIRLLAKGGMGAVYEACDERLGNTVAVKQTFYTDDAFGKAFEREAHLLAGLNHPALPKVFDHFTENNGRFLVMEFIPGSDLGQSLEARRRPFSVKQVLQWADQLLDVVEYLHGQTPAIIHRDIKPANLKVGEAGEIILLDFGLAKGLLTRAGKRSVRDSIVAYTPGYAPVEQIRGIGTDTRGDLYAVAATIYHLMTGVQVTDSLERTMNLVTGKLDPVRPAHELNPNIPKAVSLMLKKALSLNPDHRPATAAEMRRVIGCYVSETNGFGDASDPALAPTMRFEFMPPPSNPKSEKRFRLPFPKLPTLSDLRFLISLWLGGRRVALAVVLAMLIAAVTVSGVAVGFRKPKTGEVWVGAQTEHAVPVNPEAVKSVQNREAVTTAKPVDVPTWNPPSLVLQPFAFQAVKVNSFGDVLNRRNLEGRQYVEDLGAAKLEMVEIPAGSFQMGLAKKDADAVSREFATEEDIRQLGRKKVDEYSRNEIQSESPQHKVNVGSFLMGKFEVTQAQWKAVMGGNPSARRGDNLPVDNVSWEDAVEFCRRLSEKTGKKYRLPSEAEWEYACRAGSTSVFCFGDTVTSNLVNFDGMHGYADGPKGASRNKSVPVGSLGAANAFGLHDMHGNVWEWCADWFHFGYEGAPTNGSPWLEGGNKKTRIMRGGSWFNYARLCRSSNRGGDVPKARQKMYGLRVVMEIPKQTVSL